MDLPIKNAKQLDGCYPRLLETERKMILSPISCSGPQPKVVDQEEGHQELHWCAQGVNTEIDIEELRNVLEQDKCS